MFLYPLLQTADILLYKGTHVPIGDDQLAHLNLSKHLAAKFNNSFKSPIFPIPNEILSLNPGAGRIKSLRSPDKKMSKSELDLKSRIELTDSSDQVRLKIRKSVTDFNSSITYEPESRPGVANLVQIWSNVTGQSTEEIVNQCSRLDTLQFKTQLGELLAEYLKPIRTKILEYFNDRQYLESILVDGADRANQIAEKTFKQVQLAVGSSIGNRV